MKEQPVVLEVFSNEAATNVVKGFLETNGITAYVFDNDPAHRFSLHAGTNLDFTVTLMVEAPDFQKARKMLEEQLRITPPAAQSTETEIDDSADAKRKQNAKNILKIGAIIILAGYILFRLPLIARW